MHLKNRSVLFCVNWLFSVVGTICKWWFLRNFRKDFKFCFRSLNKKQFFFWAFLRLCRRRQFYILCPFKFSVVWKMYKVTKNNCFPNSHSPLFFSFSLPQEQYLLMPFILDYLFILFSYCFKWKETAKV